MAEAGGYDWVSVADNIMVFLDYAWKILFVVVFFGLCIFFHELGHLLVALWRGLYVERFSVGFGKKIWGCTYKGVEYVVSCLPFGGYVALPQLEPAAVPVDSQGNELPVASPGSRALTALAGPLANVVFGFFLATITWWIGVYEPAPASQCTVWEVPAILPLYKDGLKESDEVLAVDGKEVKGPWQEIVKNLKATEAPLQLLIRRKGQTQTLVYHPVLNPEYVAGLRPLDRIVAVNGKPLSRGWEELSERIVLNTDDLTLTIERDGEGRKDLVYRPAKNPLAEGLGYPFFTVISPTEVVQVKPDMPAAKAGFRKGDRLVRVNGKRIPYRSMFIDTVQASKGAPLEVTVRRGDRTLTLHVQAKPVIDKQGKEVYRIGFMLQGPRVIGHPSPWEQFVDVLSRTEHILGTLFAPMRGEKSLVKVRHMSGPVGIIGMIWYRISTEGIRGGLSIIILISFSLAFFNLLPIPVLDGGHILFAGIEALTRRRLPVKLVHALQYLFAYALIGLMVYITFRDMLRLPKFLKAFGHGDEPPIEQVAPAPDKAPPAEVPPAAPEKAAEPTSD